MRLSTVLRVLATALLVDAALSQSLVPEGSQLARALEGVWCNSDDGGKTCWGYDEFHANGLITACGELKPGGQIFRAAAQFKIVGRRACYVVTEASQGFALSPGDRFCTKQRYRDLDSGEVTTIYRRAKHQEQCPELRT